MKIRPNTVNLICALPIVGQLHGLVMAGYNAGEFLAAAWKYRSATQKEHKFTAAEDMAYHLKYLAICVIRALLPVVGGLFLWSLNAAPKKNVMFSTWDPVKSYSSKKTTTHQLTLDPITDPLNVEQIRRDVQQRGDNISLFYVTESGEMKSENAKELLNNHSDLKALGNRVIRDTEPYRHLLASKPPEMDDKEYIVAKMLFLSSQNSLNELGLRATSNNFTPSYGNNPSTTFSEIVVDFHTGQIGLAQAAIGVGVSGNIKSASFMIKMVFDCTQEAYNAPTTTLHLFDKGDFTEDQILKGLQH